MNETTIEKILEKLKKMGIEIQRVAIWGYAYLDYNDCYEIYVDGDVVIKKEVLNGEESSVEKESLEV